MNLHSLYTRILGSSLRRISLVCALGLIMCGAHVASAQKAYVLPSPTDANSELTLYIDMNQSEDGIQNNGLSAILDAYPDTSVYLWTWNPSGPVDGNGNWDDSADSQELTKVGTKLYAMTFVPTQYYLSLIHI